MIPVYEPSLGREEFQTVTKALESGWISSQGKFIFEFERKFAQYCGVKYGVACSNGTTALHLALESLNIGKGDEVIVPTLTFVATANAVMYTGAKPIFIDSTPEYWCIEPEKIVEKIGKHTKAVIPVHLYGHPCDMKRIMEIAQDHGLFVIEDAAESHGAEYLGKKTGSFGDVSCFSFYGNKIITTGEGGMCLTSNEELAERMRILRSHGMNPQRKYWHDVIGYNYRMTNLQAALGVAQLTKIDLMINKKRKIASMYKDQLRSLEEKGKVTLQPEMSWAKSVYWMVSLLFEERFRISRDQVIRELSERGVETRPFFHPIHTFPMYKDRAAFPISEDLAKKGVNLPSSANLKRSDIELIVDYIYDLSE